MFFLFHIFEYSKLIKDIVLDPSDPKIQIYLEHIRGCYTICILLILTELYYKLPNTHHLIITLTKGRKENQLFAVRTILKNAVCLPCSDNQKQHNFKMHCFQV